MLTSQVLARQLTCPSVGRREQSGLESRFDSEYTLVTFFEHLIGLHIDYKSSGLLREFDCSNGIADIVLFELHSEWRRSLALKNVPPRWAYWLYSLPYPESFETEIARQAAGVTRRVAVTYLKLMADLGFCEKVAGCDQWRMIAQPKPFIESFYAIEAKLRDWKRALSQATRYKDYATQSWVLLDEYAVRAALNNLDQFEHLNVGLISISHSASVTAHFVPHTSTPKSQLRFWQANAEAARRFVVDPTS